MPFAHVLSLYKKAEWAAISVVRFEGPSSSLTPFSVTAPPLASTVLEFHHPSSLFLPLAPFAWGPSCFGRPGPMAASLLPGTSVWLFQRQRSPLLPQACGSGGVDSTLGSRAGIRASLLGLFYSLAAVIGPRMGSYLKSF